MGADGLQSLFGEFPLKEFGAFQTMLRGMGLCRRPVDIMQKARAAPEFGVLAKFFSKPFHHGLACHAVLEEMILHAVCVQQGQGFFSR